MINKYEAFFSQLLQDTSGAAGITGSISYRDVWDVERFIGWSNDIFDVGKGILGGGIHEDRDGEGLGISINEEGDDDGDGNYTDNGNCGEDGGGGGEAV